MNEAKTIKESRKADQVHPSRAQDNWDNVDIHSQEDTPWTQGQSLDAPPARPGMRQRWVRVAVRGEDDPTNASRKSREGWKPRPASTLPANFPLPSISHGQWAGCVGVEGSVLMEMPEALAKKRDAFIKKKGDQITDGIESALQAQSNPNMPISQSRKTQVGRLIKVADE